LFQFHIQVATAPFSLARLRPEDKLFERQFPNECPDCKKRTKALLSRLASATEENHESLLAEAIGRTWTALGQSRRPVDARNIEGPIDYPPGYDAFFLEDPTGNRLAPIFHNVALIVGSIFVNLQIGSWLR